MDEVTAVTENRLEVTIYSLWCVVVKTEPYTPLPVGIVPVILDRFCLDRYNRLPLYPVSGMKVGNTIPVSGV